MHDDGIAGTAGSSTRQQIEPVPPTSRRPTAVRVVVRAAVLLATFLCAAELAARADDWALHNRPFQASGKRDVFLLNDKGFVRGIPHALVREWTLNSIGFRGPDVALQAPAGTTRIMLLGASEMFGTYQPEGKDLRTVLERELRRFGRFEVVNAALPGMTPWSAVSYWQHWASRLQPDIVLIYANPHFYLATALNRNAAAEAAPPASRFDLDSSRFVRRLRDHLEMPDWLSEWVNLRTIARRRSSHAHDWVFQAPPPDRLDAFGADLRRLVRAVRSSGARPIVATYALRSTAPDDVTSRRLFTATVALYPRATEQVIVDFTSAANERTRAIAAQEGATTFDAASHLTGTSSVFGDLVHFSDEGIATLASLLVPLMRAGDDRGRASSASHALQ